MLSKFKKWFIKQKTKKTKVIVNETNDPLTMLTLDNELSSYVLEVYTKYQSFNEILKDISNQLSSIDIRDEFAYPSVIRCGNLLKTTLILFNEFETHSIDSTQDRLNLISNKNKCINLTYLSNVQQFLRINYETFTDKVTDIENMLQRLETNYNMQEVA